MGTLLLVYLTLFIGVTMFGRSYLVWRRTGVNPYVLGKSDSAFDYIGRLFRVLVVLILSVVVVYAWAPAAYRLLTPIGWLDRIWLDTVGIALLSFALLWIVVAQAQMGNNWRIGIDKKEQTDLVQSGVFRLSRNPIFLGMRLLLFGLFLVLPSAVMLALWWLGDVLLQIQVRLEETHLSNVHGEQYQVYARKTRRWL